MRRRTPRAASHASRSEHASSPEPSRLEPLLCAGCGAPQPLGDGDAVTCPFCGAVVPLPPPYKMLRDAARMSAQDAATLEALARDISRPPSAVQRATMIVGYGVGILTLVVVGLGAILGAILGFILAAAADMGEDLGAALAVLGGIVGGVVSVPFTGEWLVGLAVWGSMDDAYRMATGLATQWSFDAVAAGALYLLGIVPLAIAQRTQENVAGVRELQATLRAAPPATEGGAARCRACGAPLDVHPGALAARCVYCNADNLLAVPGNVAAKRKKSAEALNRAIRDAVAEHEKTRRSDRATMWAIIAVGPVVVPLICGAGWLFHWLVNA